jgi:hypothetical protein
LIDVVAVARSNNTRVPRPRSAEIDRDYDFPIDSASHDSSANGAASDNGSPPSRQNVTGLRGAPVEFDARRAKRIVTAVVTVGLAVLVITLFATGARQNSQISSLKQHGVLVSVKVVTCVGELGGSGSNVSSYNCSGTFDLAGNSYDVTVPGSSFRTIGSSVQLIAATNDPRLVATRGTLRNEHTSAKVFILPTVLLVVFAAMATVLVVRRRRGSVFQSH